MSVSRIATIGSIVLALVVVVTSRPKAEVPPSGLEAAAAAMRRDDAELRRDPYFDAVSTQGQQARGIYVSAPFADKFGAAGVIRAVQRADSDAAVIDLKDGAGRVSYDTAIPELQEQKTGHLGDAKAFISELKAAGIYTIARVVCFADPQLPARMPERGIIHVRRKTPWTSWGTGGHWLDPYNLKNHDMILALTKEAEALGFDEVQLDYIRFPVDDGTQYAEYPGKTDESPSRPDLLLGLLKRIDEAIHIPLGVDVFGLTAFRRGDRDGLGQDLELWTKHVEVYSPMLYLNSMRNWDLGKPDRVYGLIYTGVSRMRKRLGPKPVIRPFLQSFRQGAGELYSPQFIADQIRGARVGQADGFLFWHPGSNYGMLNRGMRTAAKGMSPFPLGNREALRLQRQ